MADDGGDLSVIKAFHNAGADSLHCLRLFSRSGATNSTSNNNNYNNTASGCYILGVWAGIAAREYIKSTTVLKKWTDSVNNSDNNNNNNKIDVVVVNDALCREMIRDCLLRRGVNVEFYEKSLSVGNNNTTSNSNYVCVQHGSPGNIADFEATLFAFDEAEIQLMATGAIVLYNPHLNGKTSRSANSANDDVTGGIRVGFACLNTTLRQFSVAEFLDNIQLNSLDALVAQTNLKELTLCTISSSNKNKNNKKMKKNVDTSSESKNEVSRKSTSIYSNHSPHDQYESDNDKDEEEEEHEEENTTTELDPEVEQEQTIRRICERANVKLHFVELGKDGKYMAQHNPTLAVSSSTNSATTSSFMSTPPRLITPNTPPSSSSSVDVLRELLRVPEERLSLLSLPLASRALEVILSLIDVIDPIHRRAYYLRQVIPQTFMSLDNAAIEALHLISNKPEPRNALPISIYAWLNRCFTGMGSRAMRQWLLQPLRSVDDINQRLTMVELFVENPLIRDVLISKVLKPCVDMDRLNRKLQRRHIQLKEIQSFLTFVSVIGDAISTLQMYSGRSSKLVGDEYIAPLEDIHAHMGNLKTLIEVTVDLSDRYNARINHGFDDTLQELHHELNRVQAAIEQEHQRVLGSYDWNEKQLKCEYHHIYGYVFRVSRKEDRQLRNNSKHLHTVQTAKDGVRFVTDELASLSDRYKRLNDEYDARQQSLKVKLIDTIASYLPVLDDAKEIIAALDVFVAWALVVSTSPRGMIRPTLLEGEEVSGGLTRESKCGKDKEEENEEELEHKIKQTLEKQSEHETCVKLEDISNTRMHHKNSYSDKDAVLTTTTTIIELKNVRHPLVELRQNQYVANSVQLTSRHNGLVITGPNMGGKSTFMRSVGIAVVLAQIGCYIPADAATIRLRDAIRCRVGATDHLAQGVSTFMVEMLESSAIINASTRNTLAIIDELGRGTSTYDGFGLAWAIAKEIAVHIRSTLLFSTHFHELTQLAHEYDNVQNVHFGADVNETEGTLQFSYSLSPGPCGRSYGLYVAALAHMPDEVVAKAKEKAAELENFETEYEMSTSNNNIISSTRNDCMIWNKQENDLEREQVRKLHERVAEYTERIKNIECMPESPERETKRRALQQELRCDDALQRVLQSNV